MFRVSNANSRVRKAIDDSMPQIKNSSNGVLPSIVIVFDASSGLMCLDSENFLQAMFGDEQFNFNNYQCEFGKNRKVSKNHNTTISAIGWLRLKPLNILDLILFHNPFAKNPLIKTTSFSISEYNFELLHPDKLYQKWKRITPEL